MRYTNEDPIMGESITFDEGILFKAIAEDGSASFYYFNSSTLLNSCLVHVRCPMTKSENFSFIYLKNLPSETLEKIRKTKGENYTLLEHEDIHKNDDLLIEFDNLRWLSFPKNSINESLNEFIDMVWLQFQDLTPTFHFSYASDNLEGVLIYSILSFMFIPIGAPLLFSSLINNVVMLITNKMPFKKAELILVNDFEKKRNQNGFRSILKGSFFIFIMYPILILFHACLFLIALALIPLHMVNNTIRHNNFSKIEKEIFKAGCYLKKPGLEISEDIINKIVLDYESSYRKVHPLKFIFLTWGLGVLQQSRSSANLYKELKDEKIDLKFKTQAIKKYFFKCKENKEGRDLFCKIADNLSQIPQAK